MRNRSAVSVLALTLVTLGFAPTVAKPQQPAANTQCSADALKSFNPDGLTSIVMVKRFRKGEPLSLDGRNLDTIGLAQADLCLVKLNVGPGNSGPAGAPSTSRGIGIEIWLPDAANWNERIHVLGGGGWAGGVEGSVSAIVLAPEGESKPADIAGLEGAVSASTDTGHSDPSGMAMSNGSFGFSPDGSINRVLWHDFAVRGIHEMAVKTKALTAFYYGRSARFSYWDGFSTGGRQGLKEAQANPQDFDGILAGAPAINWTRFITGELYPQTVMLRDLGHRIAPEKLNAVSQAAISACDHVGGIHLGFIPDFSTCRYDPVRDKNVLCAASGGNGATGTCVTLPEARAINKFWYGLTRDGSVPNPVVDNGTRPIRQTNHLWYGLTRGTSLFALAGDRPFPIATDLISMELGNPKISTPMLRNATGDGQDLWQNLGYRALSSAYDKGIKLQPQFSDINTDNPDLSEYQRRGGKLLLYHGTADVLIPPQGSVNYYERVSMRMGGLDKVTPFFRFFLIPGMSHSFSNGTANAKAAPPIPRREQLYRALTDWVEKGIAPTRFDLTNSSQGRMQSFPLCMYPSKARFVGGDPLVAASYACGGADR